MSRAPHPIARGRRVWARTPLRVRLVALLTLLVALALACAGLVATATLRGYLTDRVDAQLSGVAASMAEHRVRAPGADEGRGGDPDGDGARLPSAFVVEVTDPDGTPVYGPSSNLLDHDEPLPALPRLTTAQAADRAGTPFTVPARSGDTDWRVLALPLAGGGGTLLVAQSLADVQSTVTHLQWLELVVGASAVVVLAGVGSLVVRAALRPLRDVEHTAAAIAAGDLTRRVPERDPRTEVGRLSAALNGMLAQIEAAFRVRAASEARARRSEERMRRFVADASHELRTPLTSIRGFAELYRQGAAREPADVARAMRRIEGEARRMGALVEDLLLLARLDEQRPLRREPVDVLGVAADAVHDIRAAAPDRDVSLHVDVTAPPVVLGDDDRLHQVLGNLLGNAVRHTPPGTPVTVRVSATGRTAGEPGWVWVEVADRGPGLSAADAERVFERFYRADASRSRDDGGSGLGLAIVSALVAGHGGQVRLRTAPGEGATFRVELPLWPHAASPAVAAEVAAGR